MTLDDNNIHSNISNLKSNLTDGGDPNSKKKKRINPTILN